MILVRRTPPIGLLFANLVLLIFAPTVGPIFAIVSYFYYITKNKIAGNYFLHVYMALICGLFSINILFSSIYEGDIYEGSRQIPVVYILFVYVSIAFALFFSDISYRKNETEVYIQSTRITKTHLALLCVFPISVTLKILYIGLGSGAEYGSQAWREIIGNSLNGVEWMLYKLWVIVPAMIYMLPGRTNAWRILMYSAALLLSTTYGGRFLLFSALVLILPLSLNDASAKNIFRISRYVIAIFLVIIVLGAIRYAIESDGAIDLSSILEAMNRQNAGVVYDFLLSYGLADNNIARELVIDRLRVASIPGLFKYDYDQTLGGYLAMVAAREFEFGHRIGGPGEVFYLAGYLGVVLYAILSVYMIAMYCDRLIRRSANRYLEASLVFFSIIFASLIDFTNLPNIVYYVGLIFFFGKIYRSFESKSYV